MAQVQLSTKRVAISKANAQVVGAVAIASFVSVFCLIASHTVLSLNSYQSRVISAKQTANVQLKANLKAADNLTSAYQKFVNTPQNVIGGNSVGTGNRDGDNGRIILDALPGAYDFPGLTSSLEKILNDQHLKVTAITGTDDQLNQQQNVSSPNPQPVPMPFTFSVTNASYASVQQLITTLQNSIRPISIDTMTISGNNTNITLSVTAHTYYQPSKSVSITKKVVK